MPEEGVIMPHLGPGVKRHPQQFLVFTGLWSGGAVGCKDALTLGSNLKHSVPLKRSQSPSLAFAR